jgi:hypothetical protein
MAIKPLPQVRLGLEQEPVEVAFCLYVYLAGRNICDKRSTWTYTSVNDLAYTVNEVYVSIGNLWRRRVLSAGCTIFDASMVPLPRCCCELLY